MQHTTTYTVIIMDVDFAIYTYTADLPYIAKIFIPSEFRYDLILTPNPTTSLQYCISEYVPGKYHSEFSMMY